MKMQICTAGHLDPSSKNGWCLETASNDVWICARAIGFFEVEEEYGQRLKALYRLGGRTSVLEALGRLSQRHFFDFWRRPDLPLQRIYGFPDRENEH